MPTGASSFTLDSRFEYESDLIRFSFNFSLKSASTQRWVWKFPIRSVVFDFNWKQSSNPTPLGDWTRSPISKPRRTSLNRLRKLAKKVFDLEVEFTLLNMRIRLARFLWQLEKFCWSTRIENSSRLKSEISGNPSAPLTAFPRFGSRAISWFNASFRPAQAWKSWFPSPPLK